MRKNDVAFNSLLDMPAIFVVWLPTKQRMADNGWIYSGRVSVTTRSDEWMWKTRMLVKELARGKRIAELCPCSRLPITAAGPCLLFRSISLPES